MRDLERGNGGQYLTKGQDVCRVIRFGTLRPKMIKSGRWHVKLKKRVSSKRGTILWVSGSAIMYSLLSLPRIQNGKKKEDGRVTRGAVARHVTPENAYCQTPPGYIRRK